MGFKARTRETPREAEMARDRFKAMAMMVRVSIYREMKAAHQAGKHETPMRPFLDEKERLGARKCCNTVCRKPSHYVQYFLDIDGRIALCKYHGEKSIEQTKRNQSETV